ncbi:MAG TPA: hypothetical protein VF484_07475, partial [Candidatus Limnocylindrales bacterium]
MTEDVAVETSGASGAGGAAVTGATGSGGSAGAARTAHEAMAHVPRLVTKHEVRATVHGTSPMGRFNSRLAVLITRGVGTMWAA